MIPDGLFSLYLRAPRIILVGDLSLFILSHLTTLRLGPVRLCHLRRKRTKKQYQLYRAYDRAGTNVMNIIGSAQMLLSCETGHENIQSWRRLAGIFATISNQCRGSNLIIVYTDRGRSESLTVGCPSRRAALNAWPPHGSSSHLCTRKKICGLSMCNSTVATADGSSAAWWFANNMLLVLLKSPKFPGDFLISSKVTQTLHRGPGRIIICQQACLPRPYEKRWRGWCEWSTL